MASFVALYFELVVIRYLSTEIRIFACLKNLALIASSFAIGLGMVVEKPPRTLKRLFPLLVGTTLPEDLVRVIRKVFTGGVAQLRLPVGKNHKRNRRVLEDEAEIARPRRTGDPSDTLLCIVSVTGPLTIEVLNGYCTASTLVHKGVSESVVEHAVGRAIATDAKHK
jgi:hypothetical protein